MNLWPITSLDFPTGHPYWGVSGSPRHIIGGVTPWYRIFPANHPSNALLGTGSDAGTLSEPATNHLFTEGFFQTGRLQFVWSASTPVPPDGAAQFWVTKPSGNTFVRTNVLTIAGYTTGSFTYSADTIMSEPGAPSFSYASGSGSRTASLWNNNTNFSGLVVYTITGSGFHRFEWIYFRRLPYSTQFGGQDRVILSGVFLPNYYTPTPREIKNIYNNFTPTQNVLSGELFLSQNSGRSFNRVGPDKLWTSIRMAGNKNTIIGTTSGDFVYRSLDSGLNWIPITNLGQRNWTHSAIANAGRILVVHQSLNNSVIWSVTGDTGSIIYNNPLIVDIDISNNGNYQTLLNKDGSITRFINDNYIISNDLIKSWSSIAIDKKNDLNDGKNQIAATSNEYLYLSTNFGETWTSILNDKFRKWTDVDISNNIIVALESGGNIFYSNNLGNTWSERNLNINARTVNISKSSPNLMLITSAIGNVYTGTNINNIKQSVLYNGSWFDGSISDDNILSIVSKRAVDEIRISYSNFYIKQDRGYNVSNVNQVYGYGNQDILLTGFSTGEITGITGENWQPAVLKKTGSLEQIASGDGFGRWNVNFVELGSPGNVFFEFIQQKIPSTGIIEFIDSTGSGLRNGDQIRIVSPIFNSAYTYSTSPVITNNFNSLDNLVNLINLTSGTINSRTVKLYSGFKENNIIKIIDAANLGADGNLIRLSRTVASDNKNIIKIPNRYFQGGQSIRDLVNTWDGIFSLSGNISAENSGIYTENISTLINNIPITGVVWKNSFDLWTIGTGLRVQNTQLTGINYLPFNQSLNIFSGNAFINKGQSFDPFSGFYIEIQRENPYRNQYTGFAQYLIEIQKENENIITKYSGILRG